MSQKVKMGVMGVMDLLRNTDKSLWWLECEFGYQNI